MKIIMIEVCNTRIRSKLDAVGFNKHTEDEGRLMALELIAKSSAGYYNSHTEEAFLKSLKLTRKNRKPNVKGYEFIMRMVYASSNSKPICYDSMTKFRG